MPIKWVTTSKEYTMLPDGTFRMDQDCVLIRVPDDQGADPFYRPFIVRQSDLAQYTNLEPEVGGGCVVPPEMGAKLNALFGGTWSYGQMAPASGMATTPAAPVLPTYRRATHDASGRPKQVAQSSASQVWAETYPVGPMTDADWRTLPDISERVKAYCQTYRLRTMGSGDVEEALEKLVDAKLVEVHK